MSSVLTTILPVFGLIALGFICARTRFIGPAAGQGLSQVFVARHHTPRRLAHTPDA